ncbi:hypothetical protein KC19_VG036300 [Ceratodon purpureus]|uniref:Uncharacterized protein n=1 Tax=Ceratodon purpureus TaxID=3225 RepID=A0A8T0HLN8_CERPU|nr:hypothetical protein KC19_VG036300 [Ceratodon purpureus]
MICGNPKQLMLLWVWLVYLYSPDEICHDWPHTQGHLGPNPASQWSGNGSPVNRASNGWAPELNHRPLSEPGSWTTISFKRRAGSSPFHRRLPQLIPRPAQTAPPSTSEDVGTCMDTRGDGPQKHARRPRSPATKEREAMAKRRARNLQTEAYAMERIAHAEGRQIRYPILTNPEGEIIGNWGKWQAADRSIAEVTVDRKIREYRKEPVAWKWFLKTIQRELDLRFYFVYPVKPEVLSSYLSMILANDRYKWHKYYVKTSGGQHQDCPDDAFAKLREFWESPEGKAKCEVMREIRSKVGKDVTFCSDFDSELTPTQQRRASTGSEEFHTPSSQPVKGNNSLQHTAAGEKLSDSWKEGMESRMDFLQSNLTELIQLIKGGAVSNRRPDLREDPSDRVVERNRGTCAPNLHEVDRITNEPADDSLHITHVEKEPPLENRIHDLSPVSGDTVLLPLDTEPQEEHAFSECAPAATSHDSCLINKSTSKAADHSLDAVQGTTSGVDVLPPAGTVAADFGVLTRGVRSPKTGACTKVPPEFQSPRDSSSLIPAKKTI